MNKLYNNYLNHINKKEENENIKKSIQNPIIKYLFLQKILNELTHQVDYTYYNNIKKSGFVLNNLDNEQLNKKIKDFITHGYEFMPENLLYSNKFTSLEENKRNKEFIKVISNANINLENLMNDIYGKSNHNKKDNTSETLNEISSKYLFDNTNSDLFFKFLNSHYNKTKPKKNPKMVDKSTNISVINIKKKENETSDILSELKTLLYKNVNKINKRNKKDNSEKETLPNNINQQK